MSRRLNIDIPEQFNSPANIDSGLSRDLSRLGAAVRAIRDNPSMMLQQDLAFLGIRDGTLNVGGVTAIGPKNGQTLVITTPKVATTDGIQVAEVVRLNALGTVVLRAPTTSINGASSYTLPSRIGLYRFLWTGNAWWALGLVAAAAASDINNDSSVSGATVKDALNTLESLIDAIPTRGIVARHDTTYSPILLAQFNGDLTDSSGNGHDMTGASPSYSEIFPGVLALDFRETTATLTSDSVAFTGDFTIEMLCRLDWPTTPVDLVKYTGGSNQAYALSLQTPGLGTFWQTGGGHTPISYSEATRQISRDDICHVAMTRASGAVQFYVNGIPAGAASTALTAPTSVTGGTLTVGGTGIIGQISSFKVIGSALNATQIKGEHNQTMGVWFGNR